MREWRKNHTTIDQLRSILTDAETGKVVGVIIAAQYSDGAITYAGSGSMCANPMLGVAAANNLAKKLLT